MAFCRLFISDNIYSCPHHSSSKNSDCAHLRLETLGILSSGCCRHTGYCRKHSPSMLSIQPTYHRRKLPDSAQHFDDKMDVARINRISPDPHKQASLILIHTFTFLQQEVSFRLSPQLFKLQHPTHNIPFSA